ncbi:MAG: DUF2207 domain-containing protein [Alphaproteobacteria bacterium]|nr:MAG: DUF2207 domain-containing protein [Alphaproteobacteria bacterium]
MRLLVLAIVLALTAGAVQAAERILDYESRIRVEADGALLVTEAITVNAEGRNIRRGIYRDFPTDYRSANGGRVRVGFELLNVTRNGKPEPHHIERRNNGIRIYAGTRSRHVSRGEHRYVFTYRTTGQLGHFDDVDELYWNVTGNGWTFPIEQVRAIVELPRGADPVDIAFYTGAQGAQGQDATVYRNGPGHLVFETTRPLRAREGLTVAVSWPAGFVERPGPWDSFWQRVLGYFRGSELIGRGLAGLAIVLGVSLLIWRKVGRDPEGGAIYPRYTPPPGFSPAAARFVHRMGFDRKGFAAALVSLAVKGAIRIEESPSGRFTLHKVGEGEKLSPGEKAMLGVLFPPGEKSIVMEQDNHKVFRRAIDALENRLVADFETIYFLRNRLWLVPGVAASLLVAVWIALGLPDPMNALFMTAWLAGWIGGGYGLVSRLGGTWAAARSGHPMNLAKAVIASAILLPLSFGVLMALYSMRDMMPIPVMIIIAALFGINVLFYELMKRPTRLGRKVKDALEGFKLYLSVAERDRLNRAHEPDRTPALFEKYLPYAMALDVETEWGAKFKDVLAQAAETRDYHPRWYAGSRGLSSDFGRFGSSLSGSLAGAVVASSTAPGSSSGAGGGGFSGGGGGGGGW